MIRTLAVFTLLLPLVACDKGTDQPPAQPEAAGAAEPTTEPGAPGVAWADKTMQQRKEHMGLVVYPAMKTAFQDFDGERFAEFKCQNCHGDDGKAVNYAMPNAVTPLSKDDPIGDANGIDEEVTKFMMETVVPQMKADLDGEEVNCFSCHLEG